MSEGFVAGVLLPHPPIAVREVGGEETQKTAPIVQAARRTAHDLADRNIDVLVLITPHGPAARDAVPVLGGSFMAGDLAAFGGPGVRVEFPAAESFRDDLLTHLNAAGMPTELLSPDGGLDHGCVVPLRFLGQEGFLPELLVVGLPLLSREGLLRLGASISETARRRGDRLAVVASGDLSHRLSPSAPGGYDPRGAEFDRAVVEGLRAGDRQAILDIPPELVQAAGQCGFIPLLVLLGAWGERSWHSKVLVYQAPFGVGYAVAYMVPRSSFRGGAGEQPPSAPVSLAREAIEVYLRDGSVLPPPAEPEDELAHRHGVFVSLKRDGRLRGCIGTIEPVRRNAAEEIIHNAISAATRDPRFPPVRLDELPQLTISVDLLMPPERVESIDQLDPARYGVIVSRGARKGLLLPDLEGIDTARRQVEIAAHKAGLDPQAPGLTLQRFEVRRHYW